jgi:soluble cytochrome b562
MTIPPQHQIDLAKSDLISARQTVNTDKLEIKTYESGIKVLQGQIQGVRDHLAQDELAVEDAETTADKMLRDIEDAIGLRIKTDESSVIQGGTATFEAEYTTGLPSNALPNDVQLLWDTGGCKIQYPGDKHRKKITVDTSSVQPGDYGISLSLTWTTP